MEVLSTTELVALLRRAAKAYYETDVPIMSDEEYDMRVEQLRSSYPNHQFFNEIGATPDGGTVSLPVPMASLDKKKPDTLTPGDLSFKGGFMLSAKLDGISALWVCGSTKKPALYLRGNGTVGQDVSHCIPYIQGLKLVSGPSVMVRGELICLKGHTTNARNWVNGLIHRKTFDAETKKSLADVYFIAYQVCEPKTLTRSQQQTWLQTNGFEIPWMKSVESIGVDQLKSAFQLLRDKYQYECDGVVVGQNCVPMISASNPKDSFAFKMPLADQKATTKVLEVEWASSRTGNWIPRIRFDPVLIGNATIEYCTGFNAQFIKEKGIGPGAQIIIRRSGDVIPTLDTVLTPVAWSQPPTGHWKWDATGVHAVDSTPIDDKTPEKMALELAHQVVTLGVEGFSKTSMLKLVQSNVRTLKNLLDVKEAEVQKILGSVNGKKLVDGIHLAVSKATEDLWIAAFLGWPKGFGAARIKSALEFESNVGAWPTKVGSPKGLSGSSFGEIRAAVPAYLEWRTNIGVPTPTSGSIGGAGGAVDSVVQKAPFKGNYVLTGFRDAILQKRLEESGWVLQERVTKTTNVLIIADSSKETTKVKSARDAGVRILTRETVSEMF
jgi:DNA ligase (NAD+)